MPAATMILLAATAGLQASARLVAFEPNVDFPSYGQDLVLTYPNIRPGIDFNEIIPSWNVGRAANASIKVELRARGGEVAGKWYTLGNWSLDHELSPRVSLNGQKDENANVLTDTLRLAKPGSTVDLQVTLRTLREGERARLKLLTLSFASTGNPTASKSEGSAAWGKVIEVPQKAQGNYPNGGVLCSPTSVSMVLGHYANTLNRPQLDRDVPEIQSSVWDQVYKGAGNWPFNTAYVGSFEGMRSYVSRLGSIADLEAWIDGGFPVICSVSFDLIRGRELSPQESGHLVVLVGFASNGDPIFNDPARKGQVRMTYKREDFEKAWLYSKRTVYLVHPEGAKIPASAGFWAPS